MRNAGAHTLTHGADAAALLSILSGGGSLTVLGGGLLLVLRGRGDDGLQIEADTRAGEPTPSCAVHLNGDEVRTCLQLRSRNREGHRGLLGLLGRHAARRNGGVPEGHLGTETCATHFLTVDRHRNGIVRVGGQLQVAACLIAGEVNRGVGVDVVVHAPRPMGARPLFQLVLARSSREKWKSYFHAFARFGVLSETT